MRGSSRVRRTGRGGGEEYKERRNEGPKEKEWGGAGKGETGGRGGKCRNNRTPINTGSQKIIEHP